MDEELRHQMVAKGGPDVKSHRSSGIWSFLLQGGVLPIAILALLLPAAAAAHHSASAYYDATKTVTVTGRVSRVLWKNPHVYLFVDAVDGGRTTTWSLETQSPVSLEQLGFRKADVSVGQTLTAEVMPALKAPAHGRIRRARFGRKLFVDDSLPQTR
jgi:hypothetical protein